MNLDAALQQAARALAAGDFPAASAAAASALAVAPFNANALRLAGLSAVYAGRAESGLPLLHQALHFDPNNPLSHGALAAGLVHVGYVDDAREHARRAVQLDPQYADGHVVLGLALTHLGLLTEAIESLRRATALRPGDSSIHNALGNALLQGGQCAAAIAAYRRAIELHPGNRVAHDNLLMALNHHAGQNPDEMFREHRRWAQLHADPFAPAQATFSNDRAADRVLRIGYLSPDFRQHAVMRFFEPVLASHDRGHFHITLYANLHLEDDVSRRIRTLADVWVPTAGMSDNDLASRIRADRIDIAIDLAGHSAGNRLPALARRPAPVQVSYLGYPNTTGMSAIDYLITDTDLDPPGTESWHTEQLIRLDRTMHAYLPPADAPPVQPRPPGTPLAFGSFNRIEKLSDTTVRAWSLALAAVPGATLTIKSPGLADELTRRHVLDRFGEQGVGGERIRLLGRDRSESEHLARYGEMDIALDSFPYNGTTTTCEALWMGVPVVTLQGPTRVTRTTAGILRAIGLPELIATSPEQFADIARALATDRARLSALRAGLRDRLRQSPLCDGADLTTRLEDALRRIWGQFATG